MRALRLIIALLALGTGPAWASDALVVQSNRSAACEEGVRGFRSAFRGSVRTVVLTDYAEVDVVRLTDEEQARVVVAVGDAALAASRSVRRTPVVGLLTLGLNLSRGPAGNVGGVGVMPAPERYLELCRSLGARRVGVVHDPARTGLYVRRAREAAKSLGIELVVREARTPKETPAALGSLKDAADVLRMLPDATVVTSATLDAWASASLERKIPIVTVSEQYLSKGAAVALEIDRGDQGRQAAELAAFPSGRAPSADARRIQVRVNETVLRNLGIERPPSLK